MGESPSTGYAIIGGPTGMAPRKEGRGSLVALRRRLSPGMPLSLSRGGETIVVRRAAAGQRVRGRTRMPADRDRFANVRILRDAN
jgi:hypothetical protein